MKKNVYNSFCTKIDHQWLRKDSIIGQQERDCFGTLSKFECECMSFENLGNLISVTIILCV